MDRFIREVKDARCGLPLSLVGARSQTSISRSSDGVVKEGSILKIESKHMSFARVIALQVLET